MRSRTKVRRGQHLYGPEYNAPEILDAISRSRSVAVRIDDAEVDVIATVTSGLLQRLDEVTPIFRRSGGLSITRRQHLEWLRTADNPLSLPRDVIKGGLMEGAQHLWAMTALLAHGGSNRVAKVAH